jgi:hypothetical protein
MNTAPGTVGRGLLLGSFNGFQDALEVYALTTGIRRGGLTTSKDIQCIAHHVKHQHVFAITWVD